MDWTKIHGRTSRRSTNRIARAVGNLTISRAFVRSVLTVIITRLGGSIACSPQIATADLTYGSAVLRVFLGFNVSAVGAGSGFAT